MECTTPLARPGNQVGGWASCPPWERSTKGVYPGTGRPAPQRIRQRPPSRKSDAVRSQRRPRRVLRTMIRTQPHSPRAKMKLFLRHLPLEEMYAQHSGLGDRKKNLATDWTSHSRPGHFRGVAAGFQAVSAGDSNLTWLSSTKTQPRSPLSGVWSRSSIYPSTSLFTDACATGWSRHEFPQRLPRYRTEETSSSSAQLRLVQQLIEQGRAGPAI